MKSIIGHTDTILKLKNNEIKNFNQLNQKLHIDLSRLKKGEVKIQVFAIFINPKYRGEMALRKTIEMIDRFYKLMKNNDQFELILDYQDIERVYLSSKIGAVLAIEGADCLVDLSVLRILYRLGVRLLSLTWNQRNQLADGVGELEANGGITRFGRQVIEEMNRLNMIIDISHLSPGSFWDVVKYSQKPVIASHSNAFTICPHPRNLTDEQLIALKEQGGHIGINFCPEHLVENRQAALEDVLHHIEHINKVIGINHITLGTDYDGISSTPRGLEDVSKLPLLAAALEKRGFSENEINQIFQYNWLNFFKENL